MACKGCFTSLPEGCGTRKEGGLTLTSRYFPEFMVKTAGTPVQSSATTPPGDSSEQLTEHCIVLAAD